MSGVYLLHNFFTKPNQLCPGNIICWTLWQKLSWKGQISFILCSVINISHVSKYFTCINLNRSASPAILDNVSPLWKWFTYKSHHHHVHHHQVHHHHQHLFWGNYSKPLCEQLSKYPPRSFLCFSFKKDLIIMMVNGIRIDIR